MRITDPSQMIGKTVQAVACNGNIIVIAFTDDESLMLDAGVLTQQEVDRRRSDRLVKFQAPQRKERGDPSITWWVKWTPVDDDRASDAALTSNTPDA
jgi:ribosomal 30S subunit maturation factor RimM